MTQTADHLAGSPNDPLDRAIQLLGMAREQLERAQGGVGVRSTLHLGSSSMVSISRPLYQVLVRAEFWRLSSVRQPVRSKLGRIGRCHVEADRRHGCWIECTGRNGGLYHTKETTRAIENEPSQAKEDRFNAPTMRCDAAAEMRVGLYRGVGS